MTRVASTGLTLPLDEAKATLLDNKGNLIEFEEQKDGTFKSKTIEGDKDAKGNIAYTYSYDLVAQPTLVTVYVNKVKNAKKTSTTKEEQKAIEDAKVVAQNAPDKKTQKEAEKVASFGKTKLG